MRRYWVVAAAVLAACNGDSGGGPPVTGDVGDVGDSGGGDTGAADAAGDAAAPGDAPGGDAAGDAGGADAGPDAGGDAGPSDAAGDAGEADTADTGEPADAVADGVADAGQDGSAGSDGGADGSTDAGPDAGGSLPEGFHPYVGGQGRIWIAEFEQQGEGTINSGLSAFLWSTAHPVAHTLSYSEGPCELWVAKAPVDCTPSCGFDAMCVDGACVPFPARQSAGVITVGGLAEPVTLTPDESAWYLPTPELLPDDLFQAGATVTAQAPGATWPAFDLSTAAVAPMEVEDTFLKMVDGQPLTVAWTPKGDGATVELALQIGWHGAPPTHVIWCTADEADGTLDVPASMVEDFPPAGGIGLFQHPSWIRRASRHVVETPSGVLELVVTSEQVLNIEHNAGF